MELPKKKSAIQNHGRICASAPPVSMWLSGRFTVREKQLGTYAQEAYCRSWLTLTGGANDATAWKYDTNSAGDVRAGDAQDALTIKKSRTTNFDSCAPVRRIHSVIMMFYCPSGWLLTEDSEQANGEIAVRLALERIQVLQHRCY